MLGFKIEKSAEMASLLGGILTLASKLGNVHILSFIAPMALRVVKRNRKVNKEKLRKLEEIRRPS